MSFKKCEHYISSWLPKLESSEPGGIAENSTPPPKPLTSEIRVETLQRLPVKTLHDYFQKDNTRKMIRDVMEATQLHRCSKSCTNNFTAPCNGRFPFQTSFSSNLSQIVDHIGTVQYRVHIRRNHTRLNNCNIPILNLWRGNMDITKVVGDPFGAVVYIALYTSKVDNKIELRETLAKLKKVADDQSTASQLGKALFKLDTSKAFCAPEAASKLLGHKHWKISSTIKRVSTLPYLRFTCPDSKDALDEKDDLYRDTSISAAFEDVVQGNENFNLSGQRFNIALPSNYGESLLTQFSSITIDYHNRPENFNDFSHKQYSQQWRTSRKTRVTNAESEWYDLRNKITVRRGQGLEQNVIFLICLNFRSSRSEV